MTIRPRLNPPARGWLADLPGPHDVPSEEPELGGHIPNQVNDIYLEFPRSFSDARGLLVYINVFYIPFMFWCVKNIFYDFRYFEDFISGSILLIISIWIASVTIRSDVSPPRDLPLRFNRLRRKMYAYEIDVVWWNPFIRWPIRAVSYDWDDVRAEAWQQQGVINGGHVMKWGVVLSVVKPGTNEVIDRFQLRAKGDGESVWAYICTYMQEGPNSLPPLDSPSRVSEDEHRLNIAYMLAPKVKWPAAMDIESRTAPTDSACRASTAAGA